MSIDPITKYVQENPLEDDGDTMMEFDVEIDAESDSDGAENSEETQGNDADYDADNEGAAPSEEDSDAEGKKKPRVKKEEVAESSSDESDSEIHRKANEWDSFEQRWIQDPAGVVKVLMESLTEEDRARVQNQLVSTSAEKEDATGAADKFEPLTEIEEDYVSFKPQLIKANEQIVQHLTSHAQLLSDMMITLEILEARMDALQEYSSITLPNADRESIRKELMKGETSSYRESAKKAAKALRQASKPRPMTPGGSNNAISIKKGESMSSIFAKISGLPQK